MVFLVGESKAIGEEGNQGGGCPEGAKLGRDSVLSVTGTSFGAINWMQGA